MVFPTLFLSFAAACSPTMTEQTRPDYRENPDPRQTFRLEVRTENAPGDFGFVRGSMQFNVANVECLPPPDSNPGGHTSPVPMRMIPFDLARRHDGAYEATVFTDGMVDEDYHGRGVCHWQLANVQVQLKATGSAHETLFLANLSGEDVRAGQQRVLSYLKASYPRHPDDTLDEPVAIGHAKRDAGAPLADEDLFTVALAFPVPER